MRQKPLIHLNLFFKKEIDNLNNELDKLSLESNRLSQVLANNRKENDSLQRLELNIDLINKSIKSLQRVSFIADRKHVFSQFKLYVKSLMTQEPVPKVEKLPRKANIVESLVFLLRNLEENEFYEECKFLYKLIKSYGKVNNEEYIRGT